MSLVFRCQKCARESRVPERYLGRTLHCPACGEAFRAQVPAAGGSTREAGGIEIPLDEIGKFTEEMSAEVVKSVLNNFVKTHGRLPEAEDEWETITQAGLAIGQDLAAAGRRAMSEARREDLRASGMADLIGTT